jgi:hypothetical protein
VEISKEMKGASSGRIYYPPQASCIAGEIQGLKMNRLEWITGQYLRESVVIRCKVRY